MVLSGSMWFFKVILKCEILLSFIYILAQRRPELSTKPHDIWSSPGELSELVYIFFTLSIWPFTVPN